MSVGAMPGRARITQWLVESRLAPEVEQNLERLAATEDVRRVVVLPDIHLGRTVNNGCVAATVDLVYPEAVGGDIGCGFSALAFDCAAELLTAERQAQVVLRQLYQCVPVLKHPGRPPLPERLTQLALSDDSLARESRRTGASQLGTLGRGNHFVEFQQEDTGRLWLMVHSGSRGMGQRIATFHLENATLSRTGLRYLDTRTGPGRAYVNDMEWAVQYATLNRLSMLARISELLASRFSVKVDEQTYLDCPHNFARQEEHEGFTYWVHRKSANSARTDETGLIAGTAGTPSFVVRGLGEARSLCSSSHGAGRILSRTEARRCISASDVRRQMKRIHWDDQAVDGWREEAPTAYRNIQDVLRAQWELVRQQARLRPVLSFKYAERAE